MNKQIRLLFKLKGISFIFLSFFLVQCSGPEVKIEPENAYNIIFLHHSTGNVVWKGKPSGLDKVKNLFTDVHAVPEWFKEYNLQSGTSYVIEERSFPAAEPYGWANYPYDYYNIWVKNGGGDNYMEEPTLENLTRDYDMIIFKHCFPVSLVNEDTGSPDINSEEKRVENYRVQYMALKEKLHDFGDTKFLVWTSAAMVEDKTNPQQAAHAKTFVDWVRTEWDEPGDNIFLWDFYELETGGGMYLKPEYARSKWDSHPSKTFAADVAPLFCNRIVDVIEDDGSSTYLTGEKK